MVINHDMRFRNARPYWKQQKMQETSSVVGCQPVSCTGAEGGRWFGGNHVFRPQFLTCVFKQSTKTLFVSK